MNKKLDISFEIHGTLCLALMGWKARCKAQAEQMDKWAADYEAEGDKAMAGNARANAEASRRFVVEADVALAAIK